MKSSRLNPFGDFPKNGINKRTKTRIQAVGPKTKSFQEVKSELFKSLPHGQFTPGWGLKFKKLLKTELHKADKNNRFEKEINDLRYINQSVYNNMLVKIKNNDTVVPKKEQWELDIKEELKNLKDVENVIINRFPMKQVSIAKF